MANLFRNSGLEPTATVRRKPAMRLQMSGFPARYGRIWSKLPLRQMVGTGEL
jgi:hypothetical protein